MAFPQHAVPVWLGGGRKNDVQYLSTWRDAPLTYFPNQDLDEEGWCVDRYDIVLGNDVSGQLFERAAALTLSNHFYPPEVMVSVSDFGEENRIVQSGDRVLQRIRVFQYTGMPILEVLTMNEITEVIDEPRRAGFTYTTTAAHSEVGEWSPTVEWRENGDVVLVISVVSRARPGASAFQRRLTRRMQLRAHKLSIQNFTALLNGKPYRAQQFTGLAPRLLPLTLLVIALLLLLGTAFGLSTKKK